MHIYRFSSLGVRWNPIATSSSLGRMSLPMRLSFLLCVVGLVLLSFPGNAAAVQAGHRLSGDEGRATFWVTDPEDPCVIHEVWLSALVGEAMPLGQGGKPSAVARVYATDHVLDTCAETELEFFDGAVDLAPDQVEFGRLESFSIHDVTVDMWSEGGNTESFSFDLTWTPSGVEASFIDDAGGRVFQVERFVPAEVTGSALMNGDLDVQGEPWSGEISHLTQIGRPTASS